MAQEQKKHQERLVLDIAIDRILDWRDETKYGRTAKINTREKGKLKRRNFVLMSDADRLYVTLKTPCLSTPVGTAWLTAENAKFQNFSEVRPRSKFSTGDTTKPTGDDMKIQRGELVNILLWLKNIYTWFTQKNINGWVTFKCQKILRKITISYKNIVKGL